jgi:hypothetical protein
MGGILGRSEEGYSSERNRGEAMDRNTREVHYDMVQGQVQRGPNGQVRVSYSCVPARTPGQHFSNNSNARGSANQRQNAGNREGSNRASQDHQVASSYAVTGGQRMGLGGPSSGAGHVANSPGGRTQGQEGPRRADEVWGSALEDAGQQLAPPNGHMAAICGALTRVEEKLQEAKAERQRARAIWATKEQEMLSLLSTLRAKLREKDARVEELENALTARAADREGTGFSFSGFTPADLSAAVHQVLQEISLFCARLSNLLHAHFGPQCMVESGKNGGVRVASERDGRHLLTALVSRALFLNFENESLTREGASCFPSSEAREMALAVEKQQIRDGDISYHEDPSFSQYCVARLEAVFEALAKQFGVPPEKAHQILWASKDLERPWFKAAKRAWLLHKLARTFSPPAEIVRQTPGMPLDALCESVQDREGSGFGNEIIHMVTMPGFKVGGVPVAKCLVYPVFQETEPADVRMTSVASAPVSSGAVALPEPAGDQGVGSLGMSIDGQGPGGPVTINPETTQVPMPQIQLASFEHVIPDDFGLVGQAS